MGENKNELYLTEIQSKLPSHLYVHIPKLVSVFPQIEALVTLPQGIPDLLRKGIYFALLQSVVRLLERNTDPLLPEILPEYSELIRSVSETYSFYIRKPSLIGSRNASNTETNLPTIGSGNILIRENCSKLQTFLF